MTASRTAIATIITTTKFNELATTSSQRAPATSQGGTAVSAAFLVPAVCAPVLGYCPRARVTQ